MEVQKESPGTQPTLLLITNTRNKILSFVPHLVQVQILWEDGFNQVAAFELLESLPQLTPPQLEQRRLHVMAATEAGPVPSADDVEGGEESTLRDARQILAGATSG